MSGAASVVQMVFSLAAVVAIILGLAWMTRRMQGLRGVASKDLRVRSTLAVGLKERVVIVEARGHEFLIGVAPGRVSLLQALGASAQDAGSGTAITNAEGADATGNPSFGEAFSTQLDKLLGR